ncbi:hypothetical protein C8N35_1011347 [Breoghania corrubedonensis]|uniref:Lipocalin-like protein n=1 Tax=Breoghania corrubedonensis TaxID=665038 RepID=A0A2T5VHU8_9HYPH|nr:hypothetical protein [Breoghania corrubedonensis]PTW63296.1 hypothetical protein C8N35_1011347 [Breoghania corrubedonensis]
MSDPIEPFLGTWILDVEASDFEQSAPPQAGSCRIDTEGQRLVFHMLALDAKGETTEAELKGVPDGKPVKLEESGLVDAMVLYFRPDGALVSEARRGGAALMTAARKISDDGRTMTITQTVHLPDDTSPIDTAVYRRAQ